jgi:hypothetical protein
MRTRFIRRPVFQPIFHLAICVASMVCSGSSADAQADSPIRWVGESPLSTGAGLASKFMGDQDIAGHPAVIFADNFESGELGAKWDETSNQNDSLAYVNASDNEAFQDSNVLGKRSLKVTATLSKSTGGGFTQWFESADRIFVRFYTQFDADCDYVHHFCTLRANKSLQGGDRWSGFGGAGKLPDGNERFSTAIEPWGNWGKWTAPGRWNFYSYWHTMTVSPDDNYWGNAFRPPTQPDIQPATWICVEMMLAHNTPGKNDGEQAFWIDGELRGHWVGFNWRTSPTLFANAFTLESYVTDRWTQQSENVVFFDNVVIAKEYIGPSGGVQ